MRRYLPELGIAIRLTLVVMVVTGLIYPLVVTGAAQALFHDRANGSLVKQNGQVIGSSLIGQNWTSDKYFHGRPSATLNASGTPDPYNAASSAASNLGPTNPALIAAVQQNADDVRCLEGLPPGPPPLVTPAPDAAASPTATPAPCAAVTQPNVGQVPVDAVTSSGSGLDPDISVAYADLQVARVAKARNLSPQEVQQLVNDHILDRQFGVLGERRVNVLDLNLALDKLGGQ
ncbi:MAG TPA: potassium-transporting ATPase subunit C [Dehalococcoidia bacterium]|jgi:K+-transporting ATPase ATPase C chain